MFRYIYKEDGKYYECLTDMIGIIVYCVEISEREYELAQQEI